MIPECLSGSYERYKADKNVFTTWYLLYFLSTFEITLLIIVT